jgi:hypothetical protein
MTTATVFSTEELFYMERREGSATAKEIEPNWRQHKPDLGNSSAKIDSYPPEGSFQCAGVSNLRAFSGPDSCYPSPKPAGSPRPNPTVTCGYLALLMFVK